MKADGGRWSGGDDDEWAEPECVESEVVLMCSSACSNKINTYYVHCIMHALVNEKSTHKIHLVETHACPKAKLKVLQEPTLCIEERGCTFTFQFYMYVSH